LNDSKSGFLVHGQIHNLDRELRKRRILLAPLRYGAGIKGKIVDAWRCGCPVVATPIGAEGMIDDDTSLDEWGGVIASNSDAFVEAAVSLYKQSMAWNKAQKTGTAVLNKLFNRDHNFRLVEEAVRTAMIEMKQRRISDVVGAVAWHQNLRCTKYFSKWIELKETMK
jgi:glycosyltransferase involved in cell wall biosynthesis